MPLAGTYPRKVFVIDCDLQVVSDRRRSPEAPRDRINPRVLKLHPLVVLYTRTRPYRSRPSSWGLGNISFDIVGGRSIQLRRVSKDAFQLPIHLQDTLTNSPRVSLFRSMHASLSLDAHSVSPVAAHISDSSATNVSLQWS